MSDIDPEIIKKTQELLGKFIKKPPLTEKLLSRPPFRFLHDIVTAVISNTGFMKGLFSDFEMNSENVKDKEAKLIFLDKFIGIVSLAINKAVDIKASSIVAGKESEKTNVLLQCLAKAINKKVDNAVFVKKVLDGEDKKILSNSTKSNSSVKTKSSEKVIESVKHSEKVNEDQKVPEKSKHRKADTHNVESASSSDLVKPQQPSKIKKIKDNNGSDDKRSKKTSQEKSEIEITKERESKKPNKSHRSKIDKPDNIEGVKESDNIDSKSVAPELPKELPKDENNLNDDNDIESLKRLQRPSSAKGTRQRHDNDHHPLSEVKEMENKKPMVRPPSARPAPPKLRKSSDANLDEGVNLSINQSKVSGLIVDMDQDSDEGDFIVEEFVGGGDIDMKFSHTNLEGNTEEDGIHGALVQKIIQSKKDFTTSDEKNNDVISHSDLNRKREKLANEKEIEKIRQNLQSLTKSVNPLGKLIDFIQEDLDTMQKEADRWRIENDKLEKKLLSEENVTNKLIKPIREKLNDETRTIAIQEEAIAKLKAKIEINSKKIETMLFNVCSASA